MPVRHWRFFDESFLHACLLNFDVTHARRQVSPAAENFFVLWSINAILVYCGRMFCSVVLPPSTNRSGPNLMVRVFRRGCPGVHIGQRVSPFAGHDQDGVLVQFGSDQRVHLGHVTAQPAEGRTQRKLQSVSCFFYQQKGNTHKSQQVTAVSISTHWTILKFHKSTKWVTLRERLCQGHLSMRHPKGHLPSVGSLRGNDRQSDANHAENGRENNDR